MSIGSAKLWMRAKQKTTTSTKYLNLEFLPSTNFSSHSGDLGLSKISS